MSDFLTLVLLLHDASRRQLRACPANARIWDVFGICKPPTTEYGLPWLTPYYGDQARDLVFACKLRPSCNARSNIISISYDFNHNGENRAYLVHVHPQK